MKICKTCRESKPSQSYAPDKRYADGRKNVCRSCNTCRQFKKEMEKLGAQNDIFTELNKDPEFHDLLINLGH